MTTRYQRKERPAETLEQKECHAEMKGLSQLKLYFKVDSLKGQVFLNSINGTQGWAKLVLIALERYSVALKRLTFNLR